MLSPVRVVHADSACEDNDASEASERSNGVETEDGPTQCCQQQTEDDAPSTNGDDGNDEDNEVSACHVPEFPTALGGITILFAALIPGLVLLRRKFLKQSASSLSFSRSLGPQ